MLEPEVPMKLGTRRAGQSGPLDGGWGQLGRPWPPQQVSGKVRAGSGGAKQGARLDGSYASDISPPPWLSKPLCAGSGAMALQD